MSNVFKYGDKLEMKWYRSAARYNNGGIIYRGDRVVEKSPFKIRLCLTRDRLLERYC